MGYSGDEEVIRCMIGRVPSAIEIDEEEEEILFTFEDGSTVRFYHAQDCCESVYIDEVAGDFEDLLGYPIQVAEVRTSHEAPGGRKTNEGSETWTFYTFRNTGGSVDVRWYGTSNGNYSERVDFVFTHGSSYYPDSEPLIL